MRSSPEPAEPGEEGLRDLLAVVAVLLGAFGAAFWFASGGPWVAFAVQLGRRAVVEGNALHLLGAGLAALALFALRRAILEKGAVRRGARSSSAEERAGPLAGSREGADRPGGCEP